MDQIVKDLVRELDIPAQSEVVKNPFSGDTITLAPVELALYEYLLGGEFYLESKYTSLDKAVIDEISNTLGAIKDYFIDNNAKAYQVLID